MPMKLPLEQLKVLVIDLLFSWQKMQVLHLRSCGSMLALLEVDFSFFHQLQNVPYGLAEKMNKVNHILLARYLMVDVM